MQNKWLVITLFVSIILFTSLNVNFSWAADPQDSYFGFNNSSNIDSSINTNTKFNQSLNESDNSLNQSVKNTSQKSV